MGPTTLSRIATPLRATHTIPTLTLTLTLTPPTLSPSQAPDMDLKKTKLVQENVFKGFIDGLLSEYGVGLKLVRDSHPASLAEACLADAHYLAADATALSVPEQAGFFLAKIIKVVSKLGPQHTKAEDDVYDCIIDYKMLELARGTDQWKLPKQPRQAGEAFTSATDSLKAIEAKLLDGKQTWFKDRLAREQVEAASGGLGWRDRNETGTAVMFFDMLRDQQVTASTPLTRMPCVSAPGPCA